MNPSFAKVALALVATSTMAFSLTVRAETEIKPIKEIFEPSGSFPESKFIKVAVVQGAPPPSAIVQTAKEAEEIKARNRDLLAGEIRDAASKGAKIIITSE